MPKWVCPECRARFPWVAGKKPKCPECGYKIEDASDDEVVVPFISLAKNRSADAIYRAEERGAQHRAHLAAEMAGMSAADMSALIPTNQRDNLREGDISAPRISSDNQVAAALAAMPSGGPQAPPLVGDASSAAGIAFSAGVASAPMVGGVPTANMGARMQKRIREIHPSAVAAEGFKNVGPIKSDMPANEINNPLYRQRV